MKYLSQQDEQHVAEDYQGPPGEPLGSSPRTGSPTVEQFETSIVTLEWLAAQMMEVNPTWLMPVNAVIGALNGCLKIAKAEQAQSENGPDDRPARTRL